MAESKLEHKVAKGVAWSFTEKLLSMVVQMAVSIVVARQLAPADFGVMAIMTFFTSVALAIVDSGFSQTLIRKTNPTEEEYHSVLIFNIVVSLVLYGILTAAAYPIAALYNSPEIWAIAPVLFLVLPINSLCVVQTVMFTREFRFALLSKIVFAASLISGVVAVVMAGRPMSIGKDLANCDAMLYSFHPGTMGGPAIADLLFGKAVPSAKTPMSFLRVVGQVPLYYNHNMGGRPTNRPIRLLADLPVEQNQTSVGGTSNYLDVEHTPLFPFGYGLSYTTFEYSNVKLDKEVYGMNDVIRVEFDLANTGNYDATEVAQLYTRDLVGSVARPVRELKKFDRITLKAGESKRITFTLTPEHLRYYNLEMERVVEPGTFKVMVGGSSRDKDLLTAEFEVK